MFRSSAARALVLFGLWAGLVLGGCGGSSGTASTDGTSSSGVASATSATALPDTPLTSNRFDEEPAPPSQIDPITDVVTRSGSATATPSPSTSPTATPSASPTAVPWVEFGPRPALLPANDAYGPANSTGRLTAFLPMSAQSWLVGSAGGGIWSTSDGGTTWTPLTDKLPCLAIGCLTAAPSNVVYAGTGEANGSAGPRAGRGMLVSRNGGRSFQIISSSQTTFAQQAIGHILVDSANPQILLVSTTQPGTPAYKSSPGIYRTTNGGVSWTKTSTSGIGAVTAAGGSQGGVYDLVAVPGTPGAYLATVLSGATGMSGIYKSIDDGVTWTAWGTGLPASDQLGRISLAFAPGNPNLVYAWVGQLGAPGGFFGLYASNNGGATWTAIPLGADGSGVAALGDQETYGNCIAVDPTVPTTVYIGGVEVARVSGINVAKGQGTFTLLSDGNNTTPWSAHVDHHQLGFIPSANTLVTCCDGGLYGLPSPATAAAAGANVWLRYNGFSAAGANLGVFQCSGVAQQKGTQSYMLCSQQDNSTYTYTGSLGWVHTRGTSGDGAPPRIDPINPSIQFAQADEGFIYRSTTGGVSFNEAMTGITKENNGAAFFAPLAIHPTQPQYVAAGREFVYETTRNDTTGVTWAAVSTNIGIVTALAYHPTNSAVLYAGTQGGRIFRRTVRGQAFTRCDNGIPTNIKLGKEVAGIAVDGKDATGNTAWCVLTDPEGNHVFQTTDGSNWTDISGNLPPHACRCILVTYNLQTKAPILFVGNDDGVYISRDLGQKWVRFGAGLPHVGVSDLDLTNDILAAATFGRGVWRCALHLTPLTPPTPPTPFPQASP